MPNAAPPLAAALLALIALLGPTPVTAQAPAKTAPAAATAWRDVPYKVVAKMPMGLRAVDPQGVFHYQFVVHSPDHKSPLPADLQLRIRAGNQLTPLPILPGGRVDLPIRQDWVDAGAAVQINQPKGRVQLSLDFVPRTPPGTRMSYAALAESGPVLERGISQMAGMMRFLAPKLRAFSLTFAAAGPQTLSLTRVGAKAQVFRTDANGVIHLPWNADWSTGLVEVSAPLKAIDAVLK